ncbi:MAG TPA: hypothetical protein VMW24_06040 [Sedimentisphaerales bacterium]|nr:hypothetical protein [Sedimentisphaerales bacterium]
MTRTQEKTLNIVAAKLGRFSRLADKVVQGWPTTWEYREFCRKHGYEPELGVFYHGAPYPFPYRRPMQCDRCGHIAPDATVRAQYFRVTLPAKAYPAHPDSEPAEILTCCPECGAEESFEEAMTCNECGDYPCTCPLTTS